MKLAGQILLIVFALLLIMTALPDLLLLPLVIVFGWIPAAKRLWSNLPFSAAELSLFFGGCALLAFGAHAFLRQFKRWSYRWTIALTGTVALVLLAVMSVVGVAHQFGWILISKEPVFVRRGAWLREKFDLMSTAKSIAKMASTNRVTSPAILRDDTIPDTHDGKRPWEKYSVLFVDPVNGHFAVLWPRDTGIERLVGAALIYPNGRVFIVKTNYMPATAQAHAANSY